MDGSKSSGDPLASLFFRTLCIASTCSSKSVPNSTRYTWKMSKTGPFEGYWKCCICRHYDRYQKRQECIPVGCVPPALYRPGGSVSGGPLSGRPPPPVGRQTLVTILPCPKLRLRAVKITRYFKLSIEYNHHNILSNGSRNWIGMAKKHETWFFVESVSGYRQS